MKKRLISIVISAALLALLIWHVDARALLQNFRATQWDVFSLALAFFIPQILTIAWRWKRLVAPFAPLPLGESVRQVLAGSTMNLVLPGKMGDLTKGWFLARAGHVSKPLGLGVVLFEKMLDVAALALFMLGGVCLLLIETLTAGDANPLPVTAVGLSLAAALGVVAVAGVAILYFVPLNRLPGFSYFQSLAEKSQRKVFYRVSRVLDGSHSTIKALQARGARRGEIISLSLLIWVLHLAQIDLLFLALHVSPAPGQFLSMVPLAIFIGLLPISIAGFGTRDAALVALLWAFPPSSIMAVALYINLRYLVPAAAGVPFLWKSTTASRA